MTPYKDKVAVVTGAGSGIGRSLAQELARRGAKGVICDVNTDRIEKVVREIEASGGKATGLTLDVSEYESVKKAVEDAFATYGRLDYIFNNAGIAIAGEVREFSIDDWRRVLNINLYGVVHGVAAAYPIMVKQGFGHIVNIASVEGLAPFPGSISYVTSKYGVVGLSNALRVEGKPYGVKVSVVCPGYIKTAIWDDCKMVNMNREELLKILNYIPGISPDECARRILRGVERNKATIVITAFAKTFWMLQRASPGLMLLVMGVFRKQFRNARIRD